jgi:hypothetical protein
MPIAIAIPMTIPPYPPISPNVPRTRPKCPLTISLECLATTAAPDRRERTRGLPRGHGSATMFCCRHFGLRVWQNGPDCLISSEARNVAGAWLLSLVKLLDPVSHFHRTAIRCLQFCEIEVQRNYQIKLLQLGFSKVILRDLGVLSCNVASLETG